MARDDHIAARERSDPAVSSGGQEAFDALAGLMRSNPARLRGRCRDRQAACSASCARPFADPHIMALSLTAGQNAGAFACAVTGTHGASLTCPAGDGDVQVWPAPPGRREVMNIALASPVGRARLEVPAFATSGFLHRTDSIVAAGRENEFIDLDNELGQLLGRA
jgi:hypothetical protein